MRVYLLIAAIAGGVTWLITPLVRHLAIAAGAVGKVRARDVHTVPTPRMGGVGMLIGFVVAIVFASRLPFISGAFIGNDEAWIVAIGAVLIVALGVLDDIFDLDWMLKLAGQLLISVFVSWGGIRVVSLPFGSLITASPSLSVAFTALVLVTCINAVNFVDGLDGLAAGIAGIGGIAFAAYSYMLARHSPSYASIATLIDVALVGICVGFLLHNWHPAKLFMGDSGSMLLGYLITCASMVVTGHLDPSTLHTSQYVPVFMPILLPLFVLFLPLLDMVLAIVRRLARGQSPMHPDRQHLHHRMLRIGHSVQGAVLILWAWAALFAFGSLLTIFLTWQDVVAVCAVAACVLLVVTFWPCLRRRRIARRAVRGRVGGRSDVQSAHHARRDGDDAPADSPVAAGGFTDDSADGRGDGKER